MLEQCSEIMEALKDKSLTDDEILKLQRAKFRFAEIHQNNSEHTQAVETYESLLKETQAVRTIFDPGRELAVSYRPPLSQAQIQSIVLLGLGIPKMFVHRPDGTAGYLQSPLVSDILKVLQ